MTKILIVLNFHDFFSGPVILIASSNGAQICAYIALIRSEQVKGMVFIGNFL